VEDGIRAIYSDGDNILLGVLNGIIWFDYKENSIERYFRYSLDMGNAVTTCICMDERAHMGGDKICRAVANRRGDRHI
jgi:hypothetical protein